MDLKSMWIWTMFQSFIPVSVLKHTYLAYIDLLVLNSLKYEYLHMFSIFFMYICSAYYAMSEETQEIMDNMQLPVGTTCT